MNRLAERFRRARDERRLLLVSYLPAGYPTRREFGRRVGLSFERGVDALEVSLPGQPSPLDGPVIQKAVTMGSACLPDAAEAIECAVAERREPSQAVIALATGQAAADLGPRRLVELCVTGGADALLLPDRSIAEQLRVARLARDAGVEPVIFVQGRGDAESIARAGLERPVVYLQSAPIRTGGPFDPCTAVDRLRALRSVLDEARVMVGFGLRGPREVTALAGTSADAAVIGTAAVEAAWSGPDALGELLATTVAALPKSRVVAA